MKLQENSPKFDIIVTQEIKKGKEKETLKYFSILVAKARQRVKYRRGSEHICLTFKEPVEILYDILICPVFMAKKCSLKAIRILHVSSLAPCHLIYL